MARSCSWNFLLYDTIAAFASVFLALLAMGDTWPEALSGIGGE
jgi:hypothetical protein